MAVAPMTACCASDAAEEGEAATEPRCGSGAADVAAADEKPDTDAGTLRYHCLNAQSAGSWEELQDAQYHLAFLDFGAGRSHFCRQVL